MNHCVLCDDANPNNIIFAIKGTTLYVPVVTLSSKDSQKLSKLLSKQFERPVYWNGYKTRNSRNGYRCFLKLNFLGVNKLFHLIYSNKDGNAKRNKAKRYYLPKGIIENYNVIINGKNFMINPLILI